LAWRYKGSNKVAVGAVHAKTGWILRGYTLVGYVDAADGNRLLFAVYALGRVNTNTPTAIDTLVTGFYNCGQALTDQ
jgi:D-alanyl-D-alanine carboxypeptidase/D-alanyl-D-alanine-endopeptidase (penicillin-binding protein 4)